MPFVRYATGDVAEWIPAPCRCGRTLPRLRLLQGRTTDAIYKQDGTPANALLLTIITDAVAPVLQYQVTQESLDLLDDHVRSSCQCPIERT